MTNNTCYTVYSSNTSCFSPISHRQHIQCYTDVVYSSKFKHKLLRSTQTTHAIHILSTVPTQVIQFHKNTTCYTHTVFCLQFQHKLSSSTQTTQACYTHTVYSLNTSYQGSHKHTHTVYSSNTSYQGQHKHVYCLQFQHKLSSSCQPQHAYLNTTNMPTTRTCVYLHKTHMSTKRYWRQHKKPISITRHTGQHYLTKKYDMLPTKQH